jgi:CheY-like chemotaxis protein
LVERGIVASDSRGHYRLRPAVEKPTPNAQEEAGEPSRPEQLTGASKKILFVDDDKDWRDVVSACLHDAGYEILTAKDATEAMVKTEGVKLGLIILDLDLDGESGLMLMNFLKRNQIDVPIILYTGLYHDDEQILAMLRQGAHQYVHKGPLEDCAKPSKWPCVRLDPGTGLGRNSGRLLGTG